MILEISILVICSGVLQQADLTVRELCESNLCDAIVLTVPQPFQTSGDFGKKLLPLITACAETFSKNLKRRGDAGKEELGLLMREGNSGELPDVTYASCYKRRPYPSGFV